MKKWAIRLLRIWFLSPDLERPWMVFSFMFTVFLTGGVVKAAMPDAVALPIVSALLAGAAVAWFVHRWERPAPPKPLRYNDRRCTVEILSDPPLPPQR
ncbi:MAG: hypothetical protein H6509_13930 [Bryobacterales bacterium]|nr:hypothetical protein [Acidobacteriota bacterium]MCB9385710.1 hypothetical protein [Bryobacterales bacterium]